MRIVKQLAYGALALLPLMAFASIRRPDVNAGVPVPDRAVAFRATPRQVPPAFFMRSATPHQIEARVMSFDRNHDGAVARDELLERMQGLMERDANRDGVLTPNEIALQSGQLRPPAIVRGFGGAAYGFDEESEDASRAHIDGALADLKLPKRTHERASTVVNRFLDERARRASLEGQPVGPPAPRSAVLKTRPAVPAARGFRGSRLRESERSELAMDLAGVLNDEQCADFFAAVSRRPVVKKSGFVGVRTAFAGTEIRRTNATVVVRP